MSCATATHAAGPQANPWPPDPEQTARARAANRWPDLTPELLAAALPGWAYRVGDFPPGNSIFDEETPGS